jgi:RNA exonuclease 1
MYVSHIIFHGSQVLTIIIGTTPKLGPDDLPPPPTPPPTQEALNEALKTLNTQLTNIHGNLPPRTAFIIFTGHSDPRRMSALNARKAQFDTAIKSGKAPETLDIRWTAADVRDLEGAVELARRGLLFMGIKN